MWDGLDVFSAFTVLLVITLLGLIFWLVASPELNTTTIKKQDRIYYQCPEGN